MDFARQQRVSLPETQRPEFRLLSPDTGPPLASVEAPAVAPVGLRRPRPAAGTHSGGATPPRRSDWPPASPASPEALAYLRPMDRQSGLGGADVYAAHAAPSPGSSGSGGDSQPLLETPPPVPHLAHRSAAGEGETSARCSRGSRRVQLPEASPVLAMLRQTSGAAAVAAAARAWPPPSGPQQDPPPGPLLAGLVQAVAAQRVNSAALCDGSETPPPSDASSPGEWGGRRSSSFR